MKSTVVEAIECWLKKRYHTHAMTSLWRPDGNVHTIAVYAKPDNRAYCGRIRLQNDEVHITRIDGHQILLVMSDPELYGKITRFFNKISNRWTTK